MGILHFLRNQQRILMTMKFLTNQQRILMTMKFLMNQRLMMKLLCRKRITIFGIATDTLEARAHGLVVIAGGMRIATMAVASAAGASVPGMGGVFGDLRWIFQKRMKLSLSW